ncbi:hypothetical protein DICA2_E28128 [Diutina catenulata]
MVEYASDIPLKPSQKTFCDPPDEIDDVNIEELTRDFSDRQKGVNNLHLLEAIAVLSRCLRDIIQLQEHPELFDRFRGEICRELGVDLTNDQPSSPSPPPDAEMSSNLDDDEFPESLSNNFASLQDAELLEPCELIPIETLLATTDIDAKVAHPITEPDPGRLQHEYQHNHTSSPQLLKIFNLVAAPSVTIDEFLIRIKTYSPSISVSSYLHSAYMLFNLCIVFNILPLHDLNVYRLILGSIRCSTKCLEDIFQRQKSFATVGGVSMRDLSRIEVSFLYLIKFRLVIGESILDDFLSRQIVQLRAFCKEHLPPNVNHD